MFKKIKQELRARASPAKAKILQRFFKTAPGEYGHGDVFIGLTVPEIRSVAATFHDATLEDIVVLLQSNIHEERLLALVLLVNQYKKAGSTEQRAIYRLYVSSTKYINNWDLVDLSAEHIIGAWLTDKNKAILKQLARSKNLWERRIAIISTFHYIKQGHPDETFRIATILLHDPHDLIHKAVGWMLREVGKRCGQKVEESYLKTHYHTMPRTMLRYAIERFPEQKRQWYLTGKI